MNTPQPSPPSAIILSEVSVAYSGKIEALSRVSCAIPAGSATALIGPNGAGKSTLLKAIVGLVPLSSGRVVVPAGERGAAGAAGGITYMPQRASVNWHYPATVHDVVQMGIIAARRGANGRERARGATVTPLGWLRWLRRRGREESAFVHECLHRVGLASLAERAVGELSGGQQQRLFLARSLAQRASIYLMDEPFSALDPESTERMVKVFHELRGGGATIVCAHHDMRLLESEFDYCVALNRGVSATGAPTEVLEQIRTSRASRS